jgi:hypothetical protein
VTQTHAPTRRPTRSAGPEPTSRVGGEGHADVQQQETGASAAAGPAFSLGSPVQTRPAEGGVGASSDPGAASVEQEFSFSEGEMERRLEGTPASGVKAATPGVELAAPTSSRLDKAEKAAEEQTAPPPGAGEEEGAETPAALAETAPVGSARIAEAAGGGGAPAQPPGAAPPLPGPASEYESIVDAQVAAYLNADVSTEGWQQLDATTQALLQGALALSEQQIGEPEQANLLDSLANAGPLKQTMGQGESPAQAAEEQWLEVLAQVRDVVSSIGGVVGTLGLVATVSGLILSLLVPPVGAFLLTAGRFCDLTALVLDVVSLALSVILTGYNLYRLKNATNPEEKARLLALVRRDALSTVTSAFAVATAVAPGIAKRLGGTRWGKAATGLLEKATTNLGARLAPTAVGRVAKALGGKVAKGVTGAGRRLREWTKPRLVRLRGTAPIRWANRTTGRLEERLRQYMRGVAASNTRVGRFYNRRIRGVHERNVQLARSINDPIERSYRIAEGSRMINRLEELQVKDKITDPNQLAQRIEQEFGLRRPQPGVAGDFTLKTKAGRQVFKRTDSSVLQRVRGDEFTEVQLIRDLYPGADSAELAGHINRSPFIKGIWNEKEVGVFLDLHKKIRRPTGSLIRGEVPKTPHHTIPAHMAPQIHRDPRFMQLVNDPRPESYYNKFLSKAYPGYRRVPKTGKVRSPKTGKPIKARNQREVLQGMVDGEKLTVPNRDFFDSPQFRQELTEQGSTGAWENPRNKTERLLVNAHEISGHEWDWKKEVANQIYDPATRLGLHGEPIRQLLIPTVRQSARWLRTESAAPDQPRTPAGDPVVDEPLIKAVRQGKDVAAPAGTAAPARPPVESAVLPPMFSLAGPAASPSAGAGATSQSLVARLRAQLAQPTVRLAASVAAVAPASGATRGTGGGGLVPGEGTLPAPPPSPAPSSPERLAQLRESRISITLAIQAVREYLVGTQESEEEAQVAHRAALLLIDRNKEQQAATADERGDVAAQQQQLDTSETAQQKMAAEAGKSTEESRKSKSQAEETQSEGSTVTVEAKPEEPDTRSWLERAWDATAGAVWRRIIKPVIRAAKRKVDQVMAKFGEFIMSIVNQALGLDEIEAEINAGGEDIKARRTSLQETGTGLDESEAAAVEEQQRNEASAVRAEEHIAAARTVRADAEELLVALLEHEALLRHAEEAGTASVGALTSDHAEFFQSSFGEQTEQTSAPSSGNQDEERVTSVHILPVLAAIEAVRDGDRRTRRELVEAAAQSGAAIPSELRADERMVCAAAQARFDSASTRRQLRLGVLRTQTLGCLGLPTGRGLPTLELVADEAATLTGELEGDRAAVLRELLDFHEEVVVRMGATALSGPVT